MRDEIKQAIEEAVNDNAVVLFMKGTPSFPQCGFSATVVGILKDTGTKFAAVNVLENGEVREGIKEFGNWPTIPQLYVKGKLVGGCDIVREMHADGELKPMLDAAGGSESAEAPASGEDASASS